MLSRHVVFQLDIDADSLTNICKYSLVLYAYYLPHCLSPQGTRCSTRKASLLCIAWSRLLLTTPQLSDSAPKMPDSTSCWVSFWRSSTTLQRCLACRGRYEVFGGILGSSAQSNSKMSMTRELL